MSELNIKSELVEEPNSCHREEEDSFKSLEDLRDFYTPEIKLEPTDDGEEAEATGDPLAITSKDLPAFHTSRIKPEPVAGGSVSRKNLFPDDPLAITPEDLATFRTSCIKPEPVAVGSVAGENLFPDDSLAITPEAEGTPVSDTLAIESEFPDDVKIEVIENNVDFTNPHGSCVEVLHCQHCSFHCLGRDILDKHVKSKHGYIGRNGRYKCDRCSYSTDKDAHMHQHQITHTGQRPFPCKRCDKGFTRLSDLTRHISGVHAVLRPYTCDVCGKAFTQAGNLTSHQMTHTGQRPFPCKRCDKAFTRQSNLKQHISSVHAGLRPHTCDICGKTFVRLSDLNTHQRIHTGTVVAQCEQCGKKFNYRNHYNTHRRTHTGERPYACPYCDVRFSVQSSMKAHVISAHTKEFRHRCELCGKGFIAPNVLRKHSDKCKGVS